MCCVFAVKVSVCDVCAPVSSICGILVYLSVCMLNMCSVSAVYV